MFSKVSEGVTATIHLPEDIHHLVAWQPNLHVNNSHLTKLSIQDGNPNSETGSNCSIHDRGKSGLLALYGKNR